VGGEEKRVKGLGYLGPFEVAVVVVVVVVVAVAGYHDIELGLVMMDSLLLERHNYYCLAVFGPMGQISDSS
jgi:hypothetical protein